MRRQICRIIYYHFHRIAEFYSHCIYIYIYIYIYIMGNDIYTYLSLQNGNYLQVLEPTVTKRLIFAYGRKNSLKMSEMLD